MRTRARSPSLPMPAGVLLSGLLALVGCTSLVPDRAPQSFFKLDAEAKPNPHPVAQLPAAKVERTLLIVPTPGGAAGTSHALAYSRAPGELAFYQHAQWAERPNQRIAELLLQRLESRGAFKSVALLGSGVSGDLLANVSVNELYHDLAAGGAGSGRIDVTVELVDRASRTLVGRQRFTATSPAAEAKAEAAAAALSRSVAQTVDQAAAWIERQSAAAPGEAPAQTR